MTHIEIQYSILRGTMFTLDVPDHMDEHTTDQWIREHWDQLIEPNIATSRLNTLDTHLDWTPEQPPARWYDRPAGVWRDTPRDPNTPEDPDEHEPWYGTPCTTGPHTPDDPQQGCCNTCTSCARHMCETHTARCDRCGSITCDQCAHAREDGTGWLCPECAADTTTH